MSLQSWTLLALACAFLGCAPRPPAHSRATPNAALRLASTRWPPYTDTSARQHIALDLVEQALGKAGYHFGVQILPDGALEGALRDGGLDGSPAMWRSAEREQFLVYSDGYLENRLVLVGAKGSPVTATSLAELSGKKIAIVEGYDYGPELHQATGPTFIKAARNEETLRGLLRGDVDYLLADSRVVVERLRTFPEEIRESLAVGENVLIARSLHLALRKDHPHASRIIDAFNRQLPGMITDGSYHAALGVAWVRADIDRDGRQELVYAGDAVGEEEPRATEPIATVPSTVTNANGGPGTLPPLTRFVVRGKLYNSWTAVLAAHGKAPRTRSERVPALTETQQRGLTTVPWTGPL